jgi:hypothetical protein
MLWAVKNSAGASYADMKTPSDLKIDWEDLDSNSYRSITTGNLNRNIVSTKWLKASLNFNYLTETEVENIMQKINTYPLYVKIKSPLFGTSGVFECQAYVSKASISMQQNKTNPTWHDLSFNIVQSKKVSGQ